MLMGVSSTKVSWSEDSTTGKAEGGRAELQAISGRRHASPGRRDRPGCAPRVGILRIPRWPIVSPDLRAPVRRDGL